MQISYDSRILEIMKYGPVLGHKRIPRLKIGKILHEFSFFIISKLVRLEIIRDRYYWERNYNDFFEWPRLYDSVSDKKGHEKMPKANRHDI